MDFSFTECDIEMWVLFITSGVSASSQIQFVVFSFFRFLAIKKAFLLFGRDVGDKSSPGVKIVAHGLRLVFVFPLLEDWFPI